jgi:hypothetical protein
MLDSWKRPIYADPRSISRANEVPMQMFDVFREFHQPTASGLVYPHDHIPTLALEKFVYVPVKKALLQRHGLASHWSCTHDGYWSALRYCCVPSPKKPASALDTDPVRWSATRVFKPLSELCHEPMTANAIKKNLDRKQQHAAEEGKKQKITKLDIWPLVVQNGFRNGKDDDAAHLRLIQYAKTSCSKAVYTFLFKRRNTLPQLINSIWQWETVDTVLENATRSRIATLRMAAETKCICQGDWLSTVVASFLSNKIPVQEVCQNVYDALLKGRSETVPVLVFAGARGGEGKSFFLKALAAVFGDENIFGAPEPGSFPLLDLPGKKIAVLDDWRFDAGVLPYATQCRWYDGSTLRLPRPQNQSGVSGHAIYQGTAPIFATTKLDSIVRLERLSALDPTTGQAYDVNASMTYRRLRVHAYFNRLHAPRAQIPYCPRCFSGLIFGQART